MAFHVILACESCTCDAQAKASPRIRICDSTRSTMARICCAEKNKSSVYIPSSNKKPLEAIYYTVYMPFHLHPKCLVPDSLEDMAIRPSRRSAWLLLGPGLGESAKRKGFKQNDLFSQSKGRRKASIKPLCENETNVSRCEDMPFLCSTWKSVLPHTLPHLRGQGRKSCHPWPAASSAPGPSRRSLRAASRCQRRRRWRSRGHCASGEHGGMGYKDQARQTLREE